MAPLKVLIAGASVSGLTLAITLEAYGIDYEMFEKHTEIGPFLGTTIVVNPELGMKKAGLQNWTRLC
jgi:2-polyprenyl-6-methoxyphenol hydroxylase-like FAD-dependent oxidoreductase